MKKRLFSFVLAFALLMGMLPAASAAEPAAQRAFTVKIVGASALDTLQIRQGESLIAEKAVDGSELTFSLPAGEYRYCGFLGGVGHGGGPFTVADCDGAQSLTLRAVDMTSYALSNPYLAEYTVRMTSADGTLYTAGSDDAVNGGNARGRFLLPATPEGAEYHYAFLPTSADKFGSSGTTYLYSTYGSSEVRNFKGLPASQSDSGKFVIAPKTTVAISVPTGATLRLCHRVKFYEPLELIEPTGVTAQGAQSIYTYEIPDGVTLHYELELNGYVKKAATLRGGTPITVTTADLTPAARAAELATDADNATILTNAPDSHYLELAVGERFELYLHRVLQATDSATGNYYVDPNYRVEVIGGSSVKVTDAYYAGATICAVDNGVSILRLTCDALDFVDTNGNSCVYGATAEKNAAILVVNVGGSGSTVIDTGCGGKEHEISYFVRSVNGSTAPQQFASFTLTPSSNVTAVSLHASIGSTYTDDWTPLTANGDGSYTAALCEGSSILRLRTADGTEVYHVLRALGLDVTASAKSLDVSVRDGKLSLSLNTNDELTLCFDGLQMPLPKLAALVNPGLKYSDGVLAPTTYAQYTLSGSAGEKTTVSSESSQYQIAEKNALKLSFALPDTYTLTEGALHTTYFGLGAYVGISKGGYTGTQPSYFNGINTDRDSRKELYGALPDLTITTKQFVPSSDAGVESVRVSGVEAEKNGANWSVLLPYGSAISADSAAVSVMTSHPLATVSTLVTADGGRTWRFTVTAQDGSTAEYTVAVRVSEVCARVTFYLNGGTCAELKNDATAVSYTAAKLGTALPVPTKAGYRFDGWFDTADRKTGTRYTAVSTELPDRLYALWSALPDEGNKPGTETKPEEKQITVTFRLVGSTLASKPIDLKQHPNELYGAQSIVWIPTTTYRLEQGSTVCDVFVKALAAHGISAMGAESGYVSAVNGLAEFANGTYSGWKYSVNGFCPDTALGNYVLSDGDVVVWYYVNDYRYDGVSAEEPEPTVKPTESVTSTTAGKTDAKTEPTDPTEQNGAPEVSNKTLRDVFAATGDYLQSLGAPQVGSVGGEWLVIGLRRSGREVPAAYLDAVSAYVGENADENDRLHRSKSTENSRLILALTALGTDVTDVDGHDLLRGLNDLDFICRQGLNGPVWALVALDCGNYPEPVGNVTREALLAAILDTQLPDGGWTVAGENADADTTAMVLQALAPYYDLDAAVRAAVDEAVALLSAQQCADGGFVTANLATSESISQVIVALTALGIDPDADSRFVKNGHSALDALLAYAVEGGGFRHIADGGVDGMASEQGYYALTAYVRFLDGETRLYDMTDVVNAGGTSAPEKPQPIESPESSADAEEAASDAWLWWLCVACALVLAAAVVLILRKKRK